MENEVKDRPNVWALRLIELIASNIYLRSEEVNETYRQCITVLGKAKGRQSHTLFLVKPEQ